ncbi:MAG TPA: DUF3048 domain-containing protein [Acidimicrobiia bacterium]|nr:DUF3048 domain-containing protein [Acidimicrobiia bacterium]
MADANPPSRGARRVIPWWKQRPALLGGGALVVILAIIGVALAVSGGGGDDDESSPTSAGETTTTAVPPTAPLTGLPDPEGVTATRPALNAKIANNPEARPQQGLEQADIVFEEEVEGRITRFLAVFHSQSPEAFGPIRSVRRVDPDIVWPIKGLFAYSGGVSENVSLIRAAPVQSFDETEAGDAMFLDRSFSTGERPNILFGRPQTFWEKAADRTPPAPLFTYLAAGEEFTGEPVLEVTIPVGSDDFHPTWRWDATAGGWFRFYGDEPFMTRGGAQLGTDILFVQFVPGGGAETEVIGEGDAAVLAQGQLVRGRWIREDRDSRTRFVTADGTEIAVPPGRAWVHLPMAGGELTVVPATPATTAP